MSVIEELQFRRVSILGSHCKDDMKSEGFKYKGTIHLDFGVLSMPGRCNLKGKDCGAEVYLTGSMNNERPVCWSEVNQGDHQQEMR